MLRHHKSITVKSEAVAAKPLSFGALTDIMRVDVSRWLTYTDDAKRTVTLAAPNPGELLSSKLPRAV